MAQMLSIENLNTRILAVLNLPLMDRLHELNILFERFSVRQIQEVFPLLVHSIFGINGNPLGWGLRTTTIENAPHYFNILHEFFGVNSNWMQVCHRLLNDTVKFDIDMNFLPRKFITMLQSGQNAMFYADLVNFEPVKCQLSALSLNSFDFYMFHFVLHALPPLHTVNPIALQVHNERSRTVYQSLVAEYLLNFLPINPGAVIEPANYCGAMKSPQPMPIQQMQPQRKPRFIKIPTSYNTNGNVTMHQGSSGGNTSPQSNPTGGLSRAYSWRSESVLHFFVDVWLRYDIETGHYLPSSDFVRGVRVLIKQIHYFTNAAVLDHTSLCALRKQSLTMVKSRIYAFICSLIDRWPLDSSLMVVQELWLCYIQPWRYTVATVNNLISNRNYDPPIPSSFDGFIIDNLIVYTHIFMQLMPRFERLDYTVQRNANMLYRLAKTFSQHDLVDRLRKFERLNSGNTFGFDSPQRQLFNQSNNSYNAKWNPMACSNVPQLFSESMHSQIENFLFAISLARNAVLRDIAALHHEIADRQRSEGYLKTFIKSILEKSQDELTLKDVSRIPELMRQAIDAFCCTFDINSGNLSMLETCPDETLLQGASAEKSASFDISNSINASRLSPHQLSLNASNMHSTLDPAELPLQSNEFKPLVKLLQFTSEGINKRFGEQISRLYAREDFVGKFSRQLLYAPMTEQWFGKQRGASVLLEREIPARLCLRPLASASSLCMISFSLILGKLFFGGSIFGLFIFFLLYLIYFLLRACCS